MHNTHRGSMNAPFPPLNQTWARLRAWLATEYPELGDTLNYGILPLDLQQIEMSFGFALPQAIRDSYLCADGQEAESSAGCAEGLFFGLTLLPLEDVLEEWKFWREVDDDPQTGANPRLREIMDSIPPGWIKREYSSRGWIPLIADKGGNYLGVDMNPEQGGAVGQVIVFGRDFDTKVVMWRGDGTHGWAKWLAGFVDDLESGDGFEVGATNDAASEGSEDSVGYESYFFDGTGRGLGDTGGDIGMGGMRLTGEYKGWAVLEAWADRSMRKWQEVGLVPVIEPEQPEASTSKGKVCGHLFYLVRQAHNASQGPAYIPDETLKALSGNHGGAEVPIPILADVSDPSSSTAVDDRAPVHHAGPPPPLPTISVTKPPIPMPVELPTPDDIVALDALPSHSDLEAGGNDIMMREVEPVAGPAARVTSPASPTSASQNQDLDIEPPTPAPIPPPPASPTNIITRASTATPDQVSPPSIAEVPDLLADNGDDAPSTTQIPPLVITPEASPAPSVPAEESPVLISNEDALPPDVGTVRLVGTGGTSGTATDESTDGVLVSAPDSESPEAPAAEVVANEVATPQKKGKHEKKKSKSSVKKIGSLGGGKRKTDSVSSAKSIHQ